jgi:uroporphyrinogen decarboxylase
MNIDWNEIPVNRGKPDFNNLLAVLQHKTPSRPTLFEFFLNERLYARLAPEFNQPVDDLEVSQRVMASYYRLGFDYSGLGIPGFSMMEGHVSRPKDKSISQNVGNPIHNRSDLRVFSWPDPDQANYAFLDLLAKGMPEGMKLILHGPGGVLENAVELAGYEALCMMILDDERLAFDLFEAIGSRLVRYYELGVQNSDDLLTQGYAPVRIPLA